MSVRLVTMMAAALLLVPVAAASANVSTTPHPEKKCPSVDFILNHCG